MKKNNDRGSDAISSIIGVDARLEGKLSLDSSVRVDGKFEGMLFSEGTVTVGQRGSIIGEVEADQVIIGGQVNGSVVSKTRLVLESTARVDGSIATNNLTVEEGAVFDGSCGMGAEAIGELQQKLKGTRLASIKEIKKITLFDDDGNPIDEETQSAQAS
ncbi:MAG: polymer-forming cytoskeletal protein [Candidatus Electryonea clarkiae]|nr:polymer-forming cytoskeletal protein [Candidatus Electryonea clarkiae]MDP8288377.1 polymer-forming cytoskeletal protein [Candidatus Electryonea clarkiae]